MILVAYKCRCMDKEREVEVPERPPGSDLMLWMAVMQGTLGMDHVALSPRCREDTVEYVKVPVDENAGGVGEKPHLSS